MKARSGANLSLVLVCLPWAAGAAVAQTQGLLPYPPYSKDAVDIAAAYSDDHLAEEVTAFSGHLEEDQQMSLEQQARMLDLLREEREALVAALKPAGYDANLLRRAVQKGIALDEGSLHLMQASLERLLARLADVLSPAQLERFAASERQKLDAQRRLLEMRRN